MPGPEAQGPDIAQTEPSPEIPSGIPKHSTLEKSVKPLDSTKTSDFFVTGLENGLAKAENGPIGLGDFHKMEELTADTFSQNHPEREGIHVYLQNNGINNRGVQEVTLAAAYNNGDNTKENTVFMAVAQIIDGKIAIDKNAIVYMTSEERAHELLQATLTEQDAKRTGKRNTYLTMQLFKGKSGIEKYHKDIASANKGKSLGQIHQAEDVRKKNAPGIEFLQRNAEYPEFKEKFLQELLAEHTEIRGVIDDTQQRLDDLQSQEAAELARHEAALEAKAQAEAEELARHEAAVANKDQTDETPEPLTDMEDEELINRAEWALSLLENPEFQGDNNDKIPLLANAGNSIAELTKRGRLTQPGNDRIKNIIRRFEQAVGVSN